MLLKTCTVAKSHHNTLMEPSASLAFPLCYMVKKYGTNAVLQLKSRAKN